MPGGSVGFVDDINIYSKITRVEDNVFLQSALDIINCWCCLWAMKLKPEKCKILSVRHKYDAV